MAGSGIVGVLRVVLTASTAEFDTAMRKAANEADRAAKDLKTIGTQLSGVGTAMTRAITVPLLGIGAGAAKLAIDFESAFAGVRKTVDGTVDEFGNLTAAGEAIRTGLRDMAKEIPTNVNELAKIAETAGQMGIAKDDILGFTRVMADLAVTTNLTSDEAASAIGRMQNIFGAAGKDTDRLGATIVALGNAGASTEKDIVEMALRIAGAGHTVGLTQAQVLGFANALSSVGINAEAGGSAISRVFLKINDAVAKGGQDLNEFARVAGMTGAQFKQAFEKDAASATVSFIEGIKRLKDSGENVNATIEGLIGKNIILKDTLLRASGAGDLFRSSLNLSNKAWQENAALVAEARERYKTTESQLTVLWNRIKDVGITLGNALLPTIQFTIQAVGTLLPLVDALAKGFALLPGPVQAMVIGLGGLAVAAGPVLFVTGQLITSYATVAGAFGTAGIATRALTAVMGPATVATEAQAAANVTVGATAAAGAVGVNTLKIAALGLGQALAGIGVVVGSAILVLRAWNEAQKLSAENADRAASAANEQARQYAMRAEAGRISGHSVHSYADAVAIVTEYTKKNIDELKRQAQAIKDNTAATAEWQGPLQDVAGAVKTYSDQLAAARAEVARLTPEQKKGIAAAIEMGESQKDIAGTLGISEAALRLYTQGHKAATKATNEHAEAVKRLKDEYSGAGAFEKAKQTIEAIGNVTKLTKDEQQSVLSVLQQALDKYDALGQQAPAALLGTILQLDAMITRLKDAGSAVDVLGEKFETELKPPPIPMLPSGTEGGWELHPPVEQVRNAGHGLGTQMIAGIGEVFKTQLGPTIMAAITGGGNIGQAIGGLLGQSITGSLTNWLGKAAPKFMESFVGQTLGAFLPGIGALLGPALGKVTDWFKGLFGVSKEVQESRKSLEEFQRTLRSTLTDTEKAEAGTEGWKQDVVRVRDAYLATGRTADQALAIVRQLWDTDHPDRVKAAIEEINRVLEEEKKKAGEAADAIARQKEEFDKAKEKAGDLLDQMETMANEAGIKLPKAVIPLIDKMRELGLITDEQADKFRKLADGTEVDWQRMKDAADKYGIDVDSLGDRFQSSRSHGSAQDLIDTFDFLTSNGASVGGVLQGMRDELSAFFNDAKKRGLEIPANFKPLLDNLAATGQLYDDNRLKSNQWGLDTLKNTRDIPAGLRGIIERFIETGDFIDEATGKQLTLADVMDRYGKDAPKDIQDVIKALGEQDKKIGDNNGKITDLTDTKYGEEIKSQAQIAKEGFAGIITKLDELIAKLTGPVNDALDKTLKDRTMNVDVKVRSPNVDIGSRDTGGDVNVPFNVPAFAKGGLVSTPTLGIVGEAGPELIVPLSKVGSDWPDLPSFDIPIPRVPFSDVYDRTAPLEGSRGSEAPRNTILAPVVVMMDHGSDARDVVEEVRRAVRQSFPQDFAFDLDGLATGLVPVMADRLRGKVR